MNSDGLAKLYDQLLPQERHALILAANLRGDEAEVERLVRTAPRVNYSVPHHYPQAEAFHAVALLHLARMLYLSSAYWQAMARSLDAAGLLGKAFQKRLDQVVRVLAYLFLSSARGWEQFCEGLHIPADILKVFLPPWAALEPTRESAQALAFNATEVARWARRCRRRRGGDSTLPPQVVTAEDVAAWLRRGMEVHTATWR
jgi:hypothetical protein